MEKCPAFSRTTIRLFLITRCRDVAARSGMISSTAPWMSSVSPDRVAIVLSTQVLVWVAIGGKNTILGPMIGAVALITIVMLMGTAGRSLVPGRLQSLEGDLAEAYARWEALEVRAAPVDEAITDDARAGVNAEDAHFRCRTPPSPRRAAERDAG